MRTDATLDLRTFCLLKEQLEIESEEDADSLSVPFSAIDSSDLHEMESYVPESDVPTNAVSSCVEECSDFRFCFAGFFLSRAVFAHPDSFVIASYNSFFAVGEHFAMLVNLFPIFGIIVLAIQ